jgi:ADP-heptose:LPS heptosyltransferase
MRPIAYDCRYFLGDRPCVWHKREGAVCVCDRYVPVASTTLLIKLDAVGDVLRTTCLLPVMERAWPGQKLAWITRSEAAPLLEHNPWIAETLVYGPDALTQLSARRFDRVINLDAGKVSAGLAAAARGEEKIGYVLDERGFVKPTNDAAEEWLRLGIFDDLKKANTRSYQEIMCSILGLETDGLRYVLELTEAEHRVARERLLGLGADPGLPSLGIHTGGGGRWRLKQWHGHRFRELVRRLKGERGDGLQILLFGGPLERDLNRGLAEELRGHVFDTGCENSVREFAALVSHCAVMLSGDSLAMHVALAVGARAVVLFGPTSHAEIELFGRGEKVIPDMDCLVCYKQECDFVPHCMDLITVRAVEAAVVRQFRSAGEF